MLEYKLNGDEGVCQGRIRVNSDGFLRHWTRGLSTLDLIVREFQMGCRQTDLASACVLRPLNRLVLDFKTGGLLHSVQHRNSDPRVPMTQAPSKNLLPSIPPSHNLSFHFWNSVSQPCPTPPCSISLSSYPDRGVIIPPRAYPFPCHATTLQSSQ